MEERLSSVESKASSAHHRIDEIRETLDEREVSDKRLWEKVFKHETTCSHFIPKAESAYDATKGMSIMLENMIGEIKAIHKRNDLKDSEDKQYREKRENEEKEFRKEVRDSFKSLTHTVALQEIANAEERGKQKVLKEYRDKKERLFIWVIGTISAACITFGVWVTKELQAVRLDDVKQGKVIKKKKDNEDGEERG